MATFLKGVMGQSPGASPFSGPLMSVHEYAKLATAPRKAPARSPAQVGERPGVPGTLVTMRAKPIPAVRNQADHMWVEFDDGRQQLIARGGPDSHNAEMFASGMLNDLSVMGQVDRAENSPDYRQGRRVMAERFLPNITADAAATDARRHAAGVNGRANRYGAERNSNGFAADVYERISGERVGDGRTWGYRNRLKTGSPEQTVEDRARMLPWLLSGIY